MAQIPFLRAPMRKFVLYGALFNRRDDAITIAAASSVKSIFVLPAEENAPKAAAAHRTFGGDAFSDHLSMLNA
jgi:hypothetical protein